MHSRGEPRRRHDAELKAKVLAACDAPGASVAAVARTHDLNANLVHKWRRDRVAVVERAAPATGVIATACEFVALSLPSPTPTLEPAPADIRIEVKRGTTTVVVTWPTSFAAACAAWLRELVR
jgi:transposase